MDRTARFYSAPSYGGGFPVFSGSRRRRRGGSFFGAVSSLAAPMLKGLASKGASRALSLAKDVAGDVMSGKNFKQSLMTHGIRHAKRLGSDLMGSVFNSSPKRRRVAAQSRNAPALSRKRKRKTKQTGAKRRRANF